MSVADLEAANYDEIFMQQSLIFGDSLKVWHCILISLYIICYLHIFKGISYYHFCIQDLKNLRKQLYSAAEYFEDSYTNSDEKQLWVNA